MCGVIDLVISQYPLLTPVCLGSGKGALAAADHVIECVGHLYLRIVDRVASEECLRRRNLVVHAGVSAIVIALLKRVGDDVIHQRAGLWQRISVDKLIRDRVETVPRG